MNRKGQTGAMIAGLISILIAVVIGVSVALTTIGDIVDDATDINTVTDEVISIENGTTQTTTNAGVQSASETITNADANVTLVRNTNYTIDYGDKNTAASITYTDVDNTYTGGTSGLIDYQWVASSYADSSTLRTVLGQAPLLFGVAILLLVVGFMSFKF